MRLQARTAAVANVLILIFISNLYAQPIKVVTESWRPYNYEESGKVKGICSEIVKMTLENAGLEIDTGKIRVYPWARAFHIALEKENVLIYTILCTTERKSKFKWIGPIIPGEEFYFYKNSERKDIIINKLEDAKVYKIGVIRNSAHTEFLLENGFNKELIFNISIQKYNLTKLVNNRVDLIISTDKNVSIQAKRLGVPSQQFEKTILLFKKDCYMAFSKNTSDEIVEKTRESFFQLKESGEIMKILQKYNK